MAFGANSTIAAALGMLGQAAVTIQRSIPPTTGRTYGMETIYSGNGNLQEGGGSTYYNPGGAVEVADAVMTVSSTDPSALPAVKVDDIVTRVSDGKTYTVAAISTRAWQLPHLELHLKRGGLPLQQK